MEKKRILVVDDDAVHRDFVREVLAEAGHEVTTAENGEQAMDICMRHDFDVVLTDFDMKKSGGRMTGVQFANSLADLLDKKPWVILMSGDFTKVPGFGRVTVFLQKPFTIAELLARLPPS